MKPQNIIEGALPAFAAVFVLISALWSAELSFILSVVFLGLISLYLFFRRNWN